MLIPYKPYCTGAFRRDHNNNGLTDQVRTIQTMTNRRDYGIETFFGRTQLPVRACACAGEQTVCVGHAREHVSTAFVCKYARVCLRRRALALRCLPIKQHGLIDRYLNYTAYVRTPVRSMFNSAFVDGTDCRRGVCRGPTPLDPNERVSTRHTRACVHTGG